MKTARLKAIALPMVLLSMVVLLLLTGAFVQINRDNFSLVRASTARDEAYATCEAVYQYAIYRMEHDKYFAAAPFDATEADPDLGSDLMVEFQEGSHRLEGTFRPLSSSFTAEIENNLNQDATSPTGVPAHSARLRVTSEARGLSISIESLIQVAPLFDASALSRGNTSIGASRFNVRSRDPNRNLVRAEGRIDVPDLFNGTPRTRFLNADDDNFDPRGMLWTHNHIYAGGTQVSERLEEANRLSGGRFVPEARQHFEIYNLQSEDIQVPSNVVPVDSGEYRFTMAEATIVADTDHQWEEGFIITYTEEGTTRWSATQQVHVLEYYENPGDPTPSRVYRSVTRTDDIAVPDLRGEEGETRIQSVTINYDTPGIDESIVVEPSDIVYLDADGGDRVAVDLINQHITFPRDTTVQAENDFKITTDRGEPPILQFSSSMSTDASGTTTNRAALVAGGTIDLQAGITEGYGTLVATRGDLNIRPTGNTGDVDITAVREGFGGLVVFAGNDVNLENPLDTGNTWDFNGLVYARNNFNFQANGANAKVEGTLVAREGNINFNNAEDVDFIYNPEYLETMLNELPHNRTQLERVFWRE